MFHRFRQLVLIAAVCGATSTFGADKLEKPVLLNVRVELNAGGKLSASEIKYSQFPSGKRCAFTYTGAKKPSTIAALSKLGFRTTVYCSPGAQEAAIRSMEEAGAEIGVAGYWGAKGDYGSTIGQNTAQEAFDAVITSRMDLKRSAKKPVVCGTLEGHFGPSFTVTRDPDNAYGAVFQDANFLSLQNSSHNVYYIYAGRCQAAPNWTRAKSDNTIRSERVPNELLYYQALALQFQGTVDDIKPGLIVRYSIRDFDAPDLNELASEIGEYGKHPLIWNASEGEIAGYEYAMKQARIAGVKEAGSTALDVTLALDRDTFPEHLLAPLCLEFPKGLAIKSARIGSTACAVTSRDGQAFVDVPLAAALKDGCEMALSTPALDVTVPGEIPITLTIRNTSDLPLADARLEWTGCPGRAGVGGLAVSGGPADAFKIDPKGSLVIQAQARAIQGARFGLSPVQAVIRGKLGNEERAFMAGFEIVVAPRVRVEMDPPERIPLAPGQSQHFEVLLANGRSSQPGGPLDKFISQKAGPCKGVVSLELPDGMEATPAELPFDLATADSRCSLVFKVLNKKWDKEKGVVRPILRLDGEKEPVDSVCPGTWILRDPAIFDHKPLDEKGLLVYASWDDIDKNGKLDRSVGNPNGYHYSYTSVYSSDGARGTCLASQGCNIYDSYKNINYQEGTMLFWMRRDPKLRNELQYKGDPATSWKQGVNRGNAGENLIMAGTWQQRKVASSGLSLRRYPGGNGKDGYLELLYQCMNNRHYYMQVPYDNKRLWEWRHVAMLWNVKDRRLELYLDGELAGKAEPGNGEWYAAPWDRGAQTGWKLELLTIDHGKWAGTCRDEMYIYNRALSAEEIKANMEQVKKK